MSATTDLLCPKDQVPMRVIERNGVTIERCPECGGIFLDRGELERLMRAEGEYNERAYAGDRRDDDDYDSRGQSSHDGSSSDHGSTSPYGRPRKKKRGFLQDILDIG